MSLDDLLSQLDVNDREVAEGSLTQTALRKVQATEVFHDSVVEVIRLVDMAKVAGRRMIHTHTKDDIIKFINIARRLEDLGYQMTWDKARRIVGAVKIQSGGK